MIFEVGKPYSHLSSAAASFDQSMTDGPARLRVEKLDVAAEALIAVHNHVPVVDLHVDTICTGNESSPECPRGNSPRVACRF